MKEDEIVITWLSDRDEKDVIESAVQDFDYEAIETRGVEGADELIRWIIATTLGSPVISAMIDLIKDRIKQGRATASKQGMTLRIGTDVVFENITPEQALKILKDLGRN